jgi:predicted ATPase
LVGDATDAVKMISAGLAMWRSTGATASVPFFQSYLAMAHAMLGQYEESLHHINQAMATIETTGERVWTAEVHRLAGQIALLSPSSDVAEAQAHFNRAISTARQQQAKSWELRASISLTRLWRDRGQREQAREVLAPISHWFTEGFETHDLKEAKALLESLS